jgi:transposase-like protein
MSGHNPDRVRIWRATIDAWKQSGQSVNAFCRDHNLTRSNFDRWRRILAAEPGTSAHGKPSSATFVPVRVVAEPMAEVVLRSGVVVRLPLGAAPEAVTRLVAAVGAASC